MQFRGSPRRTIGASAPSSAPFNHSAPPPIIYPGISRMWRARLLIASASVFAFQCESRLHSAIVLPTGTADQDDDDEPPSLTQCPPPTSDPGTYTLTLALDVPTLLAFVVLISLATLGGISLYRLATQKKCACPLCSQQFEIVKSLGSGGYGSVLEVRRRCDPGPPQTGSAAKRRSLAYRGSRRRAGTRSVSPSSDEGADDRSSSSGEKFVLKLIPCATLSDASAAQQEAKDLRFLRHSAIVSYVDDFLHAPPPTGGVAPAAMLSLGAWLGRGKTVDPIPGTVQGTAGGVFVCILMEWCPMDLHRYLQAEKRAQRGPMPEERLIRWAAHLISALKYCHAKGVCHRDIKSGNVFVTDDDDVRLGDFGLARSFEAARPRTVHTNAGTDCYKSPEALLGGRRDGRKADIWALGLVVLEMATQRFTWQRAGGSLGAQVLAKRAGAVEGLLDSIPAAYSAEVRTLVKRCLTADPGRRPSAEELFRSRALRRAEKTGPVAGLRNAVAAPAQPGSDSSSEEEGDAATPLPLQPAAPSHVRDQRGTAATTAVPATAVPASSPAQPASPPARVPAQMRGRPSVHPQASLSATDDNRETSGGSGPDLQQEAGNRQALRNRFGAGVAGDVTGQVLDDDDERAAATGANAGWVHVEAGSRARRRNRRQQLQQRRNPVAITDAQPAG